MPQPLPLYEWPAFTEHVVTNGGTLVLEPGAIERCAAACQRLADRMRELADQARAKLDADNPGLGETHIPSARQLADKYKQKAVGGDRIDDANTAVGILKAHQAHALEMKAMFEKILVAYHQQEAANTDALTLAGSGL